MEYFLKMENELLEHFEEIQKSAERNNAIIITIDGDI